MKWQIFKVGPIVVNRFNAKKILRNNGIYTALYLVAWSTFIIKVDGLIGIFDIDIFLSYFWRWDFWLITVLFYIFINWLGWEFGEYRK